MPSKPRHPVSPPDPAAIRGVLLDWYRRCRRDLPWRAGTPSALAGDRPDPYHVLVSEAMLQQTQVATVIDYFHRFLGAFPTVHDLAAADEQRVLRLWQGLGYYRRARHLHAAAKRIVDDHAGVVPDTVDALLQLPGVGRYTAGAVASIAYDRPAAILDGNVARVLARLHGIDDPIDAPATRDRLWALAGELADGESPGDVNQGLMELGATVCRPKSPACLTCPLRDHCAAARTGRAEALPHRLPKKKPAAVTHAVVAVERQGRFLFEQRGDGGLWAGLWQLPTLQFEAEDNRNQDAALALPGWFAERHGLGIEPPRQVDSFTHQTTHRTITFVLHHAPQPAGRLNRTGPARAWRRLDRLDDLPLANPQRKAVDLLRESVARFSRKAAKTQRSAKKNA